MGYYTTAIFYRLRYSFAIKPFLKLYKKCYFNFACQLQKSEITKLTSCSIKNCDFFGRRNPLLKYAEAFLPLLNELKFRIFQESQLKTNTATKKKKKKKKKKK